MWNLSQNFADSSCVDTDPECPELKHINQHKNYRPYSLKIKKVGVKTGDEQETEWWWWSSGCSMFTVHFIGQLYVLKMFYIHTLVYKWIFSCFCPLLIIVIYIIIIYEQNIINIMYLHKSCNVSIVHKYLQLLEEASFHKRTKCDRNNCWSTRLLRSE